MSVDRYVAGDDAWDDVADAFYDEQPEIICVTCGEDWEYCPHEDFDVTYTDSHADKRDNKRYRDQRGMQVTNRSIKTIILPMIGKRAIGPRKGR
jgi:hypothetical protein